MVKIKPFSSIYYYNKFPKANNISRFVKSASVFGNENLKYESLNDSITGSLSGINFYDESVNVNEVFKRWLESGVLTVAGGPALYVCEISYQVAGEFYCCRGFFAVMDVPNQNDCKVLSFEAPSKSGCDVLAKAMQRSHFQTTPVFALYDDDYDIKSILDECCTGACFEKAKHLGVSYKVWEVAESTFVQKMIDGFSKVNRIFLAGGGEIFNAVAVNDRQNKLSNSVLTFFMDRSSNAIAVLPVHRVVSMNMFDLSSCLEKLLQNFEHFSCKNLNSMRNKMFGLKRDGKHCFGIYAEECFGVLALKDSFKTDQIFKENSVVNELDSFIVDELILKKLLNVQIEQVQFTNSAKVAQTAVDRGDGCMAIFLNSERSDTLLSVAFSEESKCAQKVANIFPRPVDGLVFYSIEG